MFYKLYLNVWTKNKDLNTFPLPIKFFKSIISHKDWVIVEVYEGNSITKLSCGVIFIHVSEKATSPLILGSSPTDNNSSNVYRFVLDTVLQTTYNSKIDHVFLGITNANEKRKIGAKQHKTAAYVQVVDHYNDSVVSNYSSNTKLVNA